VSGIRGRASFVTRPIRAWQGYGKPQRIEVHARWSIYVAQLAPLLMLPLAAGDALRVSTALTVFLFAFALLNAALAVPVVRAAMAHHLGRRECPTGLLLAQAALVQAGLWLVLLLGPHSAKAPFTVSISVFVLVFWIMGPSLALPPHRLVPCALAMLLLALPPLAIACTSVTAAAGALVGSSLGLLGAASARCSGWMARVTWELDAARETQARLAVAEERLRFSRDLHDVLGRNLTTMALKSELAVQLARRGRPEAADQMVEVQRIAQESQREVREVVRGYRTADLAAEVTGARSVLRAAGIACRVDLGPDPATLPPLAQSVLGWVVREAATNVLRHSEAEQVSVRLWTHDGLAVLELENDGVRSAGAGAADSGSGLAGLRERLAAHSGELTVRPAPPRFTLRATLPLARTTDQELAA
jgi:two-component system sensor histidine kinase DesK